MNGKGNVLVYEKSIVGIKKNPATIVAGFLSLSV